MFKSQRVGYQSNQKLLHHYQDTTEFGLLWTKRTLSFLTRPTQTLLNQNVNGKHWNKIKRKELNVWQASVFVFQVCLYGKFWFQPNFKYRYPKMLHFFENGSTDNFGVSQPDWSHPFVTMATPKFFDQLFIYINLYQHAKKSGYFNNLFLIYGWLKNPAIWLAENNLTNISRTKIFPNMGFKQEYSKYKFSL